MDFKGGGRITLTGKEEYLKFRGQCIKMGSGTSIAQILIWREDFNEQGGSLTTKVQDYSNGLPLWEDLKVKKTNIYQDVADLLTDYCNADTNSEWKDRYGNEKSIGEIVDQFKQAHKGDL